MFQLMRIQKDIIYYLLEIVFLRPYAEKLDVLANEAGFVEHNSTRITRGGMIMDVQLIFGMIH